MQQGYIAMTGATSANEKPKVAKRRRHLRPEALEGVRLVRVTRASGRAVLVSLLRETSAATVEK